MPLVRDIIVIGASFGGLEASCALLGALPAGFAAAIMIVLHTSPQSPRRLADILGRCTSLPVSYGRHGDQVRRGHVYVAPPDRHLTIPFPGFLSLDRGPKVRHSRPAADRLFQSAAEAYGRRVIGVVLTGGDHDGTDGLKAIKAAGGISVVQQPYEARDPSMPRSALLGDHPDHCAPIGDMGALLVRLAAGLDS
jgi:two-component system, chemotaxis family, protein-glutamate methylesterase/glutaminase